VEVFAHSICSAHKAMIKVSRHAVRVKERRLQGEERLYVSISPLRGDIALSTFVSYWAMSEVLTILALRQSRLSRPRCKAD